MAVKMLFPQEGERVIDPARGSCGFLIHTIRHVQRLYGWDKDALYKYAFAAARDGQSDKMQSDMYGLTQE